MTKTIKEKQYLSWKVQLKNGQNYNFGSLSFKRLSGAYDWTVLLLVDDWNQ